MVPNWILQNDEVSAPKRSGPHSVVQLNEPNRSDALR
jgi:hypothetical protein